jgi:hypothetical protein
VVLEKTVISLLAIDNALTISEPTRPVPPTTKIDSLATRVVFSNSIAINTKK